MIRLGLALVVAAAGALIVRRMWTMVRVRGTSMEPALHDGDLLLARRQGRRAPRVGDIVIVRRPAVVPAPPGATTVHSGPVITLPPGERWLIKRVAAVAGDPLPDGVPSTMPGPVPAGTIVVFGDRAGLDSRLFGPLALETVYATVVRPSAIRAPRAG